MSDTVQALVTAVLMLSTSIWVGGYVAIAVVARSATETLDRPTRVAFFRSLGRRYLWVGTPALLVALVAGTVLLADDDGDHRGLTITSTVLVALLLGALAVAVAQARRLTRLRHQLVTVPEDTGLAQHIDRVARAALLLRASLGLLSIALVIIGAFIATR